RGRTGHNLTATAALAHHSPRLPPKTTRSSARASRSMVKYATRLDDAPDRTAHMETPVAPVFERPERARPRRAHRVDPAHVRAEIRHGLGPAEVLPRLNAAMLRRIGDSPGRFATVAHGQLTLTPTGATVRLANAGHPPPLLLRHGNVVPVEAPGTLLGVYPD